MDLPESACSPDHNTVYDRNKGKWVDIKDVPLWEIIVSTPHFWMLIVLGTLMLFA